MDIVLTLTKWFFVIGGCFFMITGAIGIHRMPEFYTRCHAASLTDTLGAGMLLVAMMMEAGWNLVAVKLILILLFLWLASPVVTHALAKAARHSGLAPSGKRLK